MNREAARLAGRHLWVGIPGPTLDAPTRQHLAALKPGGIVLFERNIEGAQQVGRLIRDLRELLGEETRLAIDEEGGLVTRLGSLGSGFPGNMALGAVAMRDVALGEHLARQQGWHQGRELVALGFDVNLAPVLDLASEGRNPVVGARSFGARPELVGRLGRAVALGLLDGGVSPVGKHFPGLGAVREDPHQRLPQVVEKDGGAALQPFLRLIKSGGCALMTSHFVVGNLDRQRPVTFSKRIVQGLLREELGFRGLVLTDDLTMGAVQGGLPFEEVVARSLVAGHDLLLISRGRNLQQRAHRVLRSHLDRVPAGQEERFLARLHAWRPPTPRSGLVGRGPEVAEAIAGRGVCVVADERHLLPLQPEERVLLLLPLGVFGPGSGDGWRGEDPGRLADCLPGPVERASFSAAGGASWLEDLVRRARSFERVLLVMDGALMEGWARRFCVEFHRASPHTILLPLRGVFDLQIIPASEPLSAVTPFGFRAVHRAALASLLMGAHSGYGLIPVELERP